MKKSRITRGIQIILVTLLVFIIGAIIVFNMSNNEVMAASCPECGKTWTMAIVLCLDDNEIYHTWHYWCDSCKINGNSYAKGPHNPGPGAQNCDLCRTYI